MDLYDSDVIKSLYNKEVVKKLVQHDRNQLIINTKGAYYYRDKLGKYQLLSGLLPRLKKCFFPSTNIFTLLKKKPKLKSGKSRGKHYGRLRGTVVHQEIEDFIFLDSKNFRKKHPSIHIYTHKILKFILETMQWRPLRSEFDIFDEALHIGTSVDIIAVTNEGKLVLMEVKCGFATYFDQHDGYMQGTLHKLTNSPHHQANIQLITEAILIAKNHQISLQDMLLYVIRVDDSDLHYYKINNEYVQKKGAKIYEQLLLNV